jgi:phosphoribosyl 1,2-cyclic phosphodiesterase
MKVISIASSSEGCCYAIKIGNKVIMIESGVPLKKVRRALNYELSFDLSDLEVCLISHEHADHSKYRMELIKYGVYCSRGGRPLTFDGISVYPHELTHDVPCFGFEVRSGGDVLFYATDTSTLPDKIQNLTHLMVEANHSMDTLIASVAEKSLKARVCDYHCSIETAVEFASLHKKTLKEVHLIHLSDTHSDELLFKKMMQEATGVPVYVAEK